MEVRKARYDKICAKQKGEYNASRGTYENVRTRVSYNGPFWPLWADNNGW